MDGLFLTVGFLLQALSVIWIIFYIRDRRTKKRFKEESLNLDVEIRELDGERLVQDWRGIVMTQEEHRSVWGFDGYPATHATDCNCGHCEMTTTHYRTNTGYINFVIDNPPTRRDVFHYLNNLHLGMIRHYREGIIRERDFSPKKVIKSHKLVERKYTIRRPGVYTMDLDFSTMDLIVRRNRDE